MVDTSTLIISPSTRISFSLGIPWHTTLLIDERIDPYGTTLTDTTQIFDTYGIFEASARTYEELCYCALNLSDTSGILTRQYKLVADAIFVNGYYKSATRLDYKHNREKYISKEKYERGS